MVHIDVLSGYLICGTGSLVGAAMLRLAAADDDLTRGALQSFVWGFVVLGLALTPAGLGADAALAVFQVCMTLGTLVGVLLIGRGVGQIQGRITGWPVMSLMIAACAVAGLSVLWLDRLPFGRLFAGMLALVASWTAWQTRGLILRPRDRTERLLGLALASLMPSVWLRLGLTLAYDGPPRADLMYTPEPYSAFFALLYSVLPMITATLLLSVLNARLHLQLRSRAATDELTGVMTRRALRELGPALIRHEVQRRKEVAVLMLDLDHFKQINDAHGHAVGDAVLVRAAATLRTHLRPDALLARYGGEEFVALVPVEDLPTARRVAERVRRAIEELDWRGAVRLSRGLTVSVGVALLDPGEPMDSALKRADEALYRAKHEGRNQCQVSLTAA